MAAESEHQHWTIRELLVRYAELLRQGQDAELYYPEVTLHLRECIQCRALLANLLKPDPSDVTSRLKPQDIAHIWQRRPQTSVMVSPGSSRDRFRVHITAPLSQREPAHSGMRSTASRGFRAIQPGGRMLLLDTLTLGGQQFQILLTLHDGNEAGRFAIDGEIYGEQIPVPVTARLHIGHETYFTSVVGGRLRFDNVLLKDQTEYISVTLETPA